MSTINRLSGIRPPRVSGAPASEQVSPTGEDARTTDPASAADAAAPPQASQPSAGTAPAFAPGDDLTRDQAYRAAFEGRHLQYRGQSTYRVKP